jgi:hypothetical protein
MTSFDLGNAPSTLRLLLAEARLEALLRVPEYPQNLYLVISSNQQLLKKHKSDQ